jgi:hypothetical protein
MRSSGTWYHVDLVGTEVSGEYVASIFRVERIYVQGTTLPITSRSEDATLESGLLLHCPQDPEFHIYIYIYIKNAYRSQTASVV